MHKRKRTQQFMVAKISILVCRFQLILLLLIVSGCATLEGKFKPTTTANVGVFADNTIAMLNETNLGFSKGQAVYTRQYYAPSEAEEQKLKESKERANKVISIMVKYSLRLVTIAETEKTGESRVNAYADFLETIDDDVLEALGLELDHYDDLLQKIRAQPKFLDALLAAQPIINSVGLYLELALGDMADDLDRLMAKIDRKIDSEFADIIRYQDTLEAEKHLVLAGMEQLYFASRGDAEAVDRLIASGVILDPTQSPKAQPSYEEMRNISEYLFARLDKIHRINKEIASDWEIYRNSHSELNRITANEHKEIRQVRLINLVWIRAHQKMASGVVNPAAWFDINEAPKELLQMGAKALF